MATPLQMTQGAPPQGYQQSPPPQGYQQSPPPQNFQQQPLVHYQQQPPVHYQQLPPANYQQLPPANYQQQPPANYQQQAPMTQTQAQGQNAPGQSEDWQNNLCDCGPVDTCLVGTCLPCVLLGKTAERLRDPTLAKYESINNDCLIMCGIMYLTGCGWILVMMKRQEIREKYGIKGSGGSDCFEAYCCPCCSLIQQEKEVERRSQAGPVVQGYQAQKEGMVMPNN